MIHTSPTGVLSPADHCRRIAISNEDAFAHADFTSRGSRHASEYDADEAQFSCRGFHGEGETGTLSEDDWVGVDERRSRQAWWELDQRVAQHNEESWLSKDVTEDGDDFAMRGDENTFSASKETSPSCSPQSLVAPAIRHQPSRDNGEGQSFEQILQQNLLRRGTRFDHFLDRCMWRVEDMIAEGTHTLAAQPLARDVDMYVELPLSHERVGIDDYTGAKRGWEETETQVMLMKGIDALLPPIRKSSSVESVEARKATRSIGSAIPKPTGRLKQEKVVRAMAQSRIPVRSFNDIKDRRVRAQSFLTLDASHVKDLRKVRRNT